jgi:hypothetical protein
MPSFSARLCARECFDQRGEISNSPPLATITSRNAPPTPTPLPRSHPPSPRLLPVHRLETPTRRSQPPPLPRKLQRRHRTVPRSHPCLSSADKANFRNRRQKLLIILQARLVLPGTVTISFRARGLKFCLGDSARFLRRVTSTRQDPHLARRLHQSSTRFTPRGTPRGICISEEWVGLM